MSVTNVFYEAVEKGDITSVRIMMKNSLLLDLSFEDFEKMKQVSASMKGLYDEHDGRELISDKTLWNDDYMNELMAQILMNFSHERLDHLQKVVRYLRPVKEKKTSNQGAERQSVNNEKRKMSYAEQKRNDQKNGSYIGGKVITGAALGAACGAAIAYAAGATVGVGAAIGAVVVGAAVATSERK